MAAFLARRLILGAVVVLAVSFGTFWFFAAHFYGPGYHHSVPPLWWKWLTGLPSGRSFPHVYAGVPVPQIGPALAHTGVLLALTMMLVVVFAGMLGTLSAAMPGTNIDKTLRVVSYTAWAVPAFLLGLLLQTIFSWLDTRFNVRPFALSGWAGYCAPPTHGFASNGPCEAGTGLSYVGNVARHAALPCIALATSFVGLHSRYLRSSLMVSLSAPYTTTARAKGLSERRVILRHALRNSLATFVSVLLADFAAIFGAALAVDWVFNIGGVGTLFLTEISDPNIDPNQVTSLLFITTLFVFGASILNDLVVAALDPRVRVR